MRGLKLGLIGVSVFTFRLCYAQISEPYGSLLYEDTLCLSPQHEWITIPSPSENIWQIGRTFKSNLDSLSNTPVIVTDTVKSYSPLSDDYFLISIPEYEEYFPWPEAIISFYHRYHTDSLMDGGFIEVSYDGGESWKNVIYDNGNVYNSFIGLYSISDTISGGVPAFSGLSNGWIYTELHWVWFALTKKIEVEPENCPILKFRFMSDSIDTNKDGWMIDRIVFRGYSVSGEVRTQIDSGIKVFPNPFADILQINVGKSSSNTVLRIYSIQGKLQLEKEIINSSILDVSTISYGLYYYTVYQSNHIITSGKLIKN